MTEMADAAKTQAFDAEVKAQVAAGAEALDATLADMARLLKAGHGQVLAALASAPTEYEQWRLTQVRAEIERVLAGLETEAARALEHGLSAQWQAGQALVDAPLAAAGAAEVVSALQAIDTRVLVALKAWCTSKIKGASGNLINRINGELGRVALGAQTPWQAAKEIAAQLEGGMKRALLITRTELGCAYATAAQNRMTQAAGKLPGLQKQWRRSRKLNPRIAHFAADGQLKPVDEAFMVGGVAIRYPRAPDAPPGERINCGCTSIPHMAHWQVSQPEREPLTADERAAMPRHRDIEDELLPDGTPLPKPARVSKAEQRDIDSVRGRALPADKDAIEDQSVILHTEPMAGGGMRTLATFKLRGTALAEAATRLDGRENGLSVPLRRFDDSGLARQTGKTYRIPGLAVRTGEVGGATVRLVGGDATLPALRGLVSVSLEGRGAEVSARLFDAIEALGVPAGRPGALDAEELYLRKIAYARGAGFPTRGARGSGEFEAGAARVPDQADRVAHMREALSAAIGRSVRRLPAYRPAGVVEGGRRVWYRPDLLGDPEWADFAGDHVLIHEITGARIGAAIREIARGGGQLAPTTDKLRRGLEPAGLSPKRDLETGGADYFFTRIKARRQDGFPAGTVTFNPRLAARVDAISYDKDYYGRTDDPDFIRTKRATDLARLRDRAMRPDNELLLKGGAGFESVEHIYVADAAERSALIDYFTKRGQKDWYGTGRWIADVIKVAKQ